MQTMATDWPTIGLVLAGELIFGIGMAALTRWMANGKLHGQTLWLVVIGVAGTVAISGPIIGWTAVELLALSFTVTGICMAVEYLTRLHRETVEAQKAQEQMVNGNTGTDR